MFPAMYLPLFPGFVVFVLLAIAIGWAVDPSRHEDSEREHH